MHVQSKLAINHQLLKYDACYNYINIWINSGQLSTRLPIQDTANAQLLIVS